MKITIEELKKEYQNKSEKELNTVIEEMTDEIQKIIISDIIIERKRKNLIEKINTYIEKNPVLLDFDSNDGLDKSQIKEILENGLDVFCSNLYENNIEYIGSVEDDFYLNLINDYEDEIINFIDSENCGTPIMNSDLKVWLYENCYSPMIDFNYKELTDTTILCNLTFYSNYDCCNSMSVSEKEDYLGEVYSVVNKGIKKKDYLNEFRGVYGSSLLTIPFSMAVHDYIEFKEKFKTSQSLTIPKNTQFGFFSSFVGGGTTFNNYTYKKMTIDINYGATKYDHIDLKADIEQSYSMEDVYGCSANDYNEVDFKLK